MPGRLGQSGASLTAIQGIAGSLVRAPVRPHSFIEMFYDHSHPSADSRSQLLAIEWTIRTGKLPRDSVSRLNDRARNDLKCVEGP